jgi:ABC-2 type transport system ATP-binding protein
MSDPVIDVRNLSRKFGNKLALSDVTIAIPRGGVFGLIGANGAGKTTLIKHLLGSLFAQSGSVSVFGLDPVREPVQVLSNVGYVSEDRDLPGWMRVQEIIDFTKAFYKTWDSNYAKELLELFELKPEQRISTLSRGQAARICLLLALAPRPSLLILDEPSSGLDTIVRRDILTAIIRTTADEGRTVLFSSHLLDEVERLADQVAILHQGRILLQNSLDSLLESFRRVSLRFPDAHPMAPELEGCLKGRGKEHDWSYVHRGSPDDLLQVASHAKAQILEEHPMTLDDIYVACVS